MYICIKYLILFMKKELIILPKYTRMLSEMGENLKLARLRRRLSAQLVADRTNISRSTLVAIEKGSPSVSIGLYMKVLAQYGLESDILLLANDDVFGRKLQDIGLKTPKRVSKKMRR